MKRISRRRFLKVSSGSAVAAKSGGLATILASGIAPAYAQGSTVNWLRWSDFVPAADQTLRDMLPEAEKALGIKINLERVNMNDLQSRITASVQSGTGPDIIHLFNNHPHLYAATAVDCSDVAEEIGQAQGGYYVSTKGNCHDGTRWLGVPTAIIGVLTAYRKSWFSDVGVTKYPDTWDGLRAAGKKLKEKGRPIGQSLGQSLGDPVVFTYPFLWSFGGKEVEEDGKTVAINSKETIEAVKYMAEFWREAHDEGGLAWDDAGNNRAFLAGTICATLNGASIYIEALRKPESYKTETGAPLKDDILHAPLPKGPKGQFGFHVQHSHVIPTYSRNQKAAKELLRWFHARENYAKWFNVSKGFYSGVTTEWENSPMWNEDPVMLPYKIAGRLGQVPGYPGPTGVKPAETLSKYLIVNMFARTASGKMSAEESVKIAEGDLKRVYG
jgi:multiple sugar transport system substrate-binding protein